MEAQQMACCGMFELCDIGDDHYWMHEEEIYNDATGEYEVPEGHRGRPTREAIRACKRAIKAELDDAIEPRQRLVLATTVRGMGIATAALRALRFRQTRRFTNGNSGNMVTLWAKYVR